MPQNRNYLFGIGLTYLQKIVKENKIKQNEVIKQGIKNFYDTCQQRHHGGKKFFNPYQDCSSHQQDRKEMKQKKKATKK